MTTPQFPPHGENPGQRYLPPAGQPAHQPGAYAPGAYGPPAPRQRPRKRHRGRNVALAAIGGLAVIGIIGSALASPKTSPPTRSSAPAAAPGTSAPASTAFTAAQQRLITDFASKFPALTFSSPSDLVGMGTDWCSALRAGEPETKLVSMLKPKAGASSAAIGRLIIRDLCPSAAPRVIARFSGSGIANSAPFLVSTGTLTVRYSYDCSAFGSSGNFIADLQTGDQASLNSDDQPIANALAMHGSTTTTVYPQDVGSEYHLAVDSECSWSIVVTSG